MEITMVLIYIECLLGPVEELHPCILKEYYLGIFILLVEDLSND